MKEHIAMAAVVLMSVMIGASIVLSVYKMKEDMKNGRNQTVFAKVVD